MPKLNIERFEKDDDSPVYMEIDEDHMKCRRSRNTYMRIVATHHGIEKLFKDPQGQEQAHRQAYGLRKIILQNLKTFMRLLRKKKM